MPQLIILHFHHSKFLFAIVAMYLCFRLRRNGERRRNPHGVIPLPLVQILSNPNNINRLDADTLAKMKTCPFNEKSLADESLQQYQTCAICIEDFDEKDMIRE